MTSPEVKIKITGDDKGAQGALKRVAAGLTSLQRLSASAFTIAGLGGTGLLAALLTVTRNAADAADKMGKLAQASGTSSEELSTLAFAAELSGANVEQLAQGLRKLSQDAATGGKNLAAVGVSLVDAGGKAKTSDQLFKDVAQRFAQLPVGVDKTAMAVRLFGDELGPKLLPLLNEGADGLKRMQLEAERLGLKLSDKATAAATEFNDNLTRLQGLVRGVGAEIGNALIPELSRLATTFLDAREAGLSWSQALVGIGLSNPFTSAADQVKKLNAEIEALRDAQASAPSSPEEISLFNVDQQIADLEKLRDYYTKQAQRTRTDEQKAEDAHARKLLQTQASLQNEIAKLADLRKKQSTAAMAEELKGAERLREALRSAWQASIDGATKATAESKKLLEDSGKARKEGNEKANERLKRDVAPEIKSQEAFTEAEQLRSQSNFKAQEAIIQGINGNTKGAITLARDALEMANKAEKLTEDITDNNLAAGLLRQLGEVKADILKAESYIKKGEAKEGEQTAATQQEELTKVETRIKTLKEELEKPFKLDADIALAETAIKTLQGELDKLQDKTITVTVNQVAGTTATAAAPAPAAGFAGGGFTGPGGKYQPKGIVHAGEFVLRSEVVRQAGMRRMLERLNRYGLDALPGFADGGLVKDQGSAMQPINLHWPDGTVTPMSARADVAREVQRVFRSAALKTGGRR